jgi:hypothetical protein
MTAGKDVNSTPSLTEEDVIRIVREEISRIGDLFTYIEKENQNNQNLND